MKRRQIFRAQASKSQTGSSARRFTNSGPVLPFNPSSIAGCQLWLDAADTSSILLSGSSNVSLWIDKSSYENNFSLTSGTTSKINDGGYSVINFPSGATMSSAKQITFTTSSAFFIVSKLTSLSAATISMVVGFTNMYDGDYTFVRYNPSTILNGTAATTTNERDLGNNNYYVNGTFNPSTFGSNYYLNTYSIIGTVSPTTSGTSYLTLSSAFSSRYFIGNIAEFLYYPTGLTTIQRQKVEGYLAHKWGIQSTLPSNHPYKSASPTYEEPVFVPTLISGSHLWLDGADTSSMTFSGSRVTGWTDKSGKGFNVATSSGATAPVYNSTTKELQFVSGNSNSFTIPQGFGDALVGKTFSFFFIGRRTVNTTYVYFLSGATSGGNQNLFIGFLSNKMEIGEYGPYASADIPTFNSPDPMRLYYYDIQTSTTANLLMNGNSLLTTVAGDLFLTSFAQPELGRRYGGDVYHDFNLSEMVVFSPALSETQRKRVEGHLIQKWGLQSNLPANHPYKTTAPTAIPKSITIQSLSALFNSSCLSIPANSTLTLGTNNHTIEFWMYQTSRSYYDCPFSYSTNTTSFSTNTYYMVLGGYLEVLIGNGVDNWAVSIGSSVSPLPALNTWHHYAIVRNGTTFTLYINGISRGSKTSSINITAQSGSFVIGDYKTNTDIPLFGYITNFRLVNGTAVYTSNFTPPTSPLTAIPNTQILIQGLVDRSPNAFTVTNNRGVALSTSMSPFV